MAKTFFKPANNYKIILASTSKGRAELMANCQLDVYKKISPSVDEELIKQEMGNLSPKKMAIHLATLKALSVLEIFNKQTNKLQNEPIIIIGADQILDLNGEILSKPKTVKLLKQRMQNLSGKTHLLYSGAAIIILRKGQKQKIVKICSTATMEMRQLSKKFIDQYVDFCAQETKGSVGGYHFEGLGAQLFKRVGGDYYTILGLPLLKILATLRNENIILK